MADLWIVEVRLIRRKDIGAVFGFGNCPAAQQGTVPVRHVGFDENIFKFRIIRKNHRGEKRGEDIHPAGNSEAYTCRTHLLEEYVQTQRIEPYAAIFFRNKDGMVAEFVHLLHAVPVRRSGFNHICRVHLVELNGCRSQDLHRKLADGFLQIFVLVGQFNRFCFL